jgi:LPS-assembly protein
LRTRCRTALTLAAALFGAVVLASVSAAQAPAPPPQVPVTVGTVGGDVTITADTLEEVGPDRLLVGTGNVELTQGKARLIADRVELNRETGDAVAQGRVVFYDGEDQLTGRRIDYNVKTGTGVVYDSETRVAPYYRISGQRMDRLGESVYHVDKGVFTTCQDDPPTWSFHFGSGDANLEDFIYGTGASFWVKDVPLIPFVPFFAAAIRRERQTGFLFPKFGNSTRRGFQAEVPFYWAISDSADATISPLLFSKVGEGFTGEYRQAVSSVQRLSLTGFVLQETAIHDSTRAEGSLRYDWTIQPGLVFKIDANGVTDDRVLQQFGDRLEQRSAQRVESNVFLTKSWEAWNFVGDVFSYQDLTTPKPIELRRLPDLNLTGVRQPIPGLPGFLYEQDTSYVNFVREIGSQGQRADFHPRISRPISPDGLFTLTPFVGGRLTAYDKTVIGARGVAAVNGPVEITKDENRLRQLLEGGADLETNLSRVYSAGGVWGIDGLLHSIEPRVQYLWINGREKFNLPVWTEGIDRIKNTSQLAFTLTNRVRARTAAVPDSEPVRWELFRFAVGSTYDLINDRPGSLLGTLIVQPAASRLRLRADLSHDLRGHGIDILTTDATLRLDPVPLSATVGWRYSDTAKINFVTTGLSTEITRYFVLRNANNFDARSGRFIESRIGGDIRFQCWSFTFEYVHRAGREDEVNVAVNLLGVGSPFKTSIGLGTLEGSGER